MQLEVKNMSIYKVISHRYRDNSCYFLDKKKICMYIYLTNILHCIRDICVATISHIVNRTSSTENFQTFKLRRINLKSNYIMARAIQ